MANEFGDGGFGDGGFGGDDLDTYAQAFRGILRAALGMPDNSVRPANQNAPAGGPGDALYATVLMMTQQTVGTGEVWYEPNEDDDTEVFQNNGDEQLLVCSLQFYNAGAKVTAGRIKKVLKLEPNRLAMNNAGLGLARVGVVKDVSQVVETIWTERVQVNVELYALFVEQATVGTFASYPRSVIKQ
jgi:hypothetical protein